MREQAENEELTSAELDMKLLKAAQQDADRRKKESVTLNDLFAKYGI